VRRDLRVQKEQKVHKSALLNPDHRTPNPSGNGPLTMFSVRLLLGVLAVQ
jgi:hypothetical protein